MISLSDIDLLMTSVVNKNNSLYYEHDLGSVKVLYTKLHHLYKKHPALQVYNNPVQILMKRLLQYYY